ncbi:MAG: nucleotidyltransferase family protein [Lachnospiraceae bacterium]|nr:nucleotidyltransferase family protein [Lachnospiraceae bacterium]
MKTVGIIAEFNPFHNGHKYLIEKAKALTGADTAVVIMSGDFVQRGAPAVCDKILRTRMALACGADIVFELPAVYALGSAEQFAYGGVKLLSSTLNIDAICFGSECGNIEELEDFAVKAEEFSGTSEFKSMMASFVKQGLSYPSAFEKVMAEKYGIAASSIYAPNNILGIEYCKALYRLQKSGTYAKLPKLYTIKREGSGYHDETLSSYPSATAVRNVLLGADNGTQADVLPEALPKAINGSLPDEVSKLVKEQYSVTLPITEDDFSDMMYLKLNTASDDELYAIPDTNKDIINKLIKYRGRHIVISKLIAEIKNKSFTYTAISRALFRVLLSPYYTKAAEAATATATATAAEAVSASAADNVTSDNAPVPYLRTLGFRSASSEFLKNLRYSDTCTIITKPADGDMNNPIYNLDIYAANLYSQICANKYKTGFTDELKTGPVIVL